MNLKTNFNNNNILNRRFRASTPNEVWTLDFTQIHKAWLLTVQDLATKRILNHQVLFERNKVIAKQINKGNSKIKDNTKTKKSGIPFTQQDVISLLQVSFRQEGIPSMIHTDSGQQFKGNGFKEFLLAHGIKQSTGNAASGPKHDAFHNQAHESFHAKLKRFIRNNIQLTLSLINEPTLEELDKLSKDETFYLIANAINQVNNDLNHETGTSPYIMQDALVLMSKTGEGLPNIVAAAGSKDALRIDELKDRALSQYAGDWVAFFVDWKQQSELRHKEAIELALKNNQEAIELALKNKDQIIDTVIAQKQDIAQKYQLLQEHLEKMQLQLNYLEEEKKREAIKFRLEEERKARRKARLRLPARDAATFLEYKQAMVSVDLLTKDKYLAARRKVCLTFIYIFGVRVSHCLKLTVFHLQQLLAGQPFIINDIKANNFKDTQLVLVEDTHALILQRENDFITLCQDKQGNDLVITPQGQLNTIYPENLNRELNRILAHTSKLFKKNIKTHSFRIGLLTTIIETQGIEVAQKVVGHANIATTALYNRVTRTHEEHKLILKIAEARRQHGYIPRIYTKRATKRANTPKLQTP